ncbi:MAG: ATPase, T2SS/T4P/T4SS family [Candidatus Bathyarchaeota archaeon]|nr:ATPase, T2SS/T4P/T4SS family [Candidatus Bathyarchaeota archaeon]
MKHPFTQERLGEILVSEGSITHQEIEEFLVPAIGLIGEKLVEAGKINEEQLAKALATQLKVPFFDLSKHTVTPELFNVFPPSQAFLMGIVPLAIKEELLTLVTADPSDYLQIERFEKTSGLKVELGIASKKDIAAVLKRSEGASAVLANVSEDFKLAIIKESDTGEEKEFTLHAIGEEDSSVIRFVNAAIGAALQKRASDIHIELHETGIAVKYRIDGVLYPATEVLNADYHSTLISRLKVMSELDIAEKRTPQDGRYKLRVHGESVDFRVSILPSIHGEDVVIRILDKGLIGSEKGGLRLENLGFSDDGLARFRRCIREPHGMVLITGPTGSGKTTTLYAALSELHTGEEKIITIEDPVEYQLDGIVQVPVNEKKNLTFASGLRSILRHDPDIIMVGEIRDPDTAKIAVQSALTGHLVFTTIHANSAFDIFTRFEHMGVDASGFISALNCVIAQRLVRKICEWCREEVSISTEELLFSGLNPENYEDQVWHQGTGCDKCSQTGFLGRTAITEFLSLSPRLRESVAKKGATNEFKEEALLDGMITLRQTGLEKALAGETTLQELNRVTFVELTQ